MSYATFLASDMPMPDMNNPHQQFLSINVGIHEFSLTDLEKLFAHDNDAQLDCIVVKSE